MIIIYRCNLDDVLRYEKFPDQLEFRPMVGDHIRSLNKRFYEVELRVVQTTIIDTNTMEVELHLIPSRFPNVSSWENFYRNAKFDNPSR